MLHDGKNLKLNITKKLNGTRHQSYIGKLEWGSAESLKQKVVEISFPIKSIRGFTDKKLWMN